MNKEVFDIPVVGAPETEEAKEAKAVKKSLLDRLESIGKIDQSWVSKNIYFILFLVGLGLVHIANNHLAENTIRDINSMQKEIKAARWNYMTEKSELMQKSMQSEVAKMVEPLGLEELKTPPFKIEIDPKNYE